MVSIASCIPSWPGRGKNLYLRDTLRLPAKGLRPSALPFLHYPSRWSNAQSIPTLTGQRPEGPLDYLRQGGVHVDGLCYGIDGKAHAHGVGHFLD